MGLWAGKVQRVHMQIYQLPEWNMTWSRMKLRASSGMISFGDNFLRMANDCVVAVAKTMAWNARAVKLIVTVQ